MTLNTIFIVSATCSPDATSPILPPKNIIGSLAAEVDVELENSDASYYAAVESHNLMNLI